ncbi:beta(1,3)galactosyltransferase EpsH [Oenococcus sp. UCMA 16435]|nr:beta(1,3)galactosyltransferase EpsH [Oenococcus sp. UCMA 16435]
MIFIILGSQKFQFNRLLKYIDEFLESGEIRDKVFAQIGHSDYEPQKYPFERFMSKNDFDQKIYESSIIITHAGTGSIISSIKKGKKVIAMPRLSKYGEHIDDHQKQIVSNFVNNKYILSANDKSSLLDSINLVRKFNFKQFISNNNKYIETIEDFLS